MSDLVDGILRVLPENNAIRVGKVTAVAAGVATVAFSGTERTFPRLSSYTAAVDDVVVLVGAEPDWLILGKIVGV